MSQQIIYRIDNTKETTSHLMRLLTSKLYNDPANACFREIFSNALDANRGAPRPVEVTIQDDLLLIRDYGSGMSPEFIKDVFTSLGSSTKTEEDIGGFGIGAKSIFVHPRVTFFTVSGGVRYEYHTAIENDLPSLKLIAATPTDEPSGTGFYLPNTVKHLSLENKLTLLIAQFHKQAQVEASLFPDYQVFDVGDGYLVLNANAEADVARKFDLDPVIFSFVHHFLFRDTSERSFSAGVYRRGIVYDIPEQVKELYVSDGKASLIGYHLGVLSLSNPTILLKADFDICANREAVNASEDTVTQGFKTLVENLRRFSVNLINQLPDWLAFKALAAAIRHRELFQHQYTYYVIHRDSCPEDSFSPAKQFLINLCYKIYTPKDDQRRLLHTIKQISEGSFIKLTAHPQPWRFLDAKTTLVIQSCTKELYEQAAPHLDATLTWEYIDAKPKTTKNKRRNPNTFLKDLALFVKPAFSKGRQKVYISEPEKTLAFLREALVFTDEDSFGLHQLLTYYPYECKIAIVHPKRLETLNKLFQIQETHYVEDFIVRNQIHYAGPAAFIDREYCDIHGLKISRHISPICKLNLPDPLSKVWQVSVKEDAESVILKRGFESFGYRCSPYKPKLNVEPPSANEPVENLLALIEPYSLSVLWEYDKSTDCGVLFVRIADKKSWRSFKTDDWSNCDDDFIFNFFLAEHYGHIQPSALSNRTEAILDAIGDYFYRNKCERYAFYRYRSVDAVSISETEFCGMLMALD